MMVKPLISVDLIICLLYLMPSALARSLIPVYKVYLFAIDGVVLPTEMESSRSRKNVALMLLSLAMAFSQRTQTSQSPLQLQAWSLLVQAQTVSSLSV